MELWDHFLSNTQWRGVLRYVFSTVVDKGVGNIDVGEVVENGVVSGALGPLPLKLPTLNGEGSSGKRLTRN